MAADEAQIPEDFMEKFAKITAFTVGEQARYFLREFIAEFSAREDGVEEVLNLCDEFVNYTDEKLKNVCTELEEHAFHLFLEKRGEPCTVTEVREKMREIDIDSNMKISFMEYCLFKYEKTLAELFAEKPNTSAALLAALDEAIALHEAVLAARKEEEDKISELTKIAGVGGVKGAKAKVELEQMRVRSQTGQNMAEVRSAFKKRQAERALKNADPMAEEMKKLELKKKQEEEQRKLERAASKKRLQDRAAFLQAK